MSWTVQDLPPSERPRERFQRLGVAALSHQELLSCVLGRGVAGTSVLIIAQRLLQHFGTLSGIAAASLEDLAQVHGVGTAKAVQLKAAFALGEQRELDDGPEDAMITDAASAAAVVEPHLRHQPTEHVIALLLDTKHRVLRVAPITAGNLNASLVHPREIFHEAIRARAAAVILAHNHPSGDPTPSDDDLALTQRVAAAGSVVGIPLLDHLIVGRARTMSLAQEGHL